ncbi:MAG: hypothetical protein NFCOHLIN_01527 [Gammaproteobacteria bacterium]|nr:hypothetical protein [Gammaproteobacteria bacterium]
MAPMMRIVFTLALSLALSACGRKGGETENTPAADAAPPQPEVLMPETAVAPVPPPGTDASVVVPMPPPADPLLTVAQNKAAAVDAGLSGYTLRSQPQVFGDVRSDISIYSSGSQIVLVEEKLTTSDNSIATNRYYFDNGKLFLFQDDGRWLELNPPSPLVTKNVRRNMAFTPTGKLITASKTIDGAPAIVGEYEAVAVLARAQQLLGPLPTAAAMAAQQAAGPTAAAPAAEAAAIPDTAASPDAAAHAPSPAQEATAKPLEPKPAVAVAAAAPEETAGGADRIPISGNKPETQVKGMVPAKGTRDYVVRAKGGQLLTLSFEGSPNAVFAVYSSRGEIVSELTNWSSKLPRDGDYTIKIGKAAGGGGADFVLNVKLE